MSVIRRYAVLAVVIIAIAAVAFLFRDRLSGNASDLAVGDCFDVPSVQTEIKDVQHHPCNEAHTGEVFAVITDPDPAGAPVPTTDAITTYFAQACLPILSAYIGEDGTTQTVLDFGGFYPTDDGWNNGDRSITCYLYRVDEGPMTTSMKGAKP